MKTGNSKTSALIIGGLTLAVNWISSFLLTPFCMKVLGIDEYGLYQLIFSVAQYVFVLDFGITSVLARYIAEYREKQDRKAEKNVAAHMFVIVVAVNVLIIFLGFFTVGRLSVLFPNLTVNQVITSQHLFIWMIIQIVITLFSHYFEGIAMGYECFSVVKLVALIRIIMKTLLVFLFLILNADVMGIVYADVIAMFIGCLFMCIFTLKKIRFQIAWQHFDKVLTVQILLLSLAMLLRSVVTYVNNALDKTLLGMFCTTSDVTLYTIAMTFITIFNAVPTIIQSLYVPSATRLVVRNASSEELTDLVIRPGRLQFVFCGGFLGAFILFGKQFVSLWTGPETTSAWLMAVIIMIPMLIPLVQNVCLAILTAKNKRMTYSIILVITTLINIPLSIILIDTIGPLGAALGTALSYLLGNCIAINIYYWKVIKLNVLRMFKEIFKGIASCIVVTCLILGLLTQLPLNGVAGFLVKCICYTVVFAGALWLWGLSEDEKSLLLRKIKRGKGIIK